jgi:hypothetical protein
MNKVANDQFTYSALVFLFCIFLDSRDATLFPVRVFASWNRFGNWSAPQVTRHSVSNRIEKRARAHQVAAADLNLEE